MASYQVVCSVIRPKAPTELCQIPDFQEKVQQHISSVFHDVHLDSSSSENGSNLAADPTVNERERTRRGQGDNPVLCALISKTKACFSGEDNFQSRVKLPFFWCNFCPFSTESKPSLLQHLTSQHCFHCHHCSYVALTRCDVVHHSLQQHPEFQRQAHEQKLKGYHLLRDVLQHAFTPEPVPEPPAGNKRSATAAEGNNLDGADPAKQPRLDNADRPQDTVGAGNVENYAEFNSNSSSSDSSEANIFTRRAAVVAHTSSASVNSREGGSNDHIQSKSLGENVVSSSSMEADTVVFVECRTEAFIEEEAEPSSVRESSPVEKDAVTIKQEVESEEGFILALQGGHNGTEEDASTAVENAQSEAASSVQSSSNHNQQFAHPVGEAVRVKTELGLEDAEQVHHKGDNPETVQRNQFTCRKEYLNQARSSTLRESRPESAVSPPLSSILVENLQRQFEESVRNINLSLHGSDQMGSSTSSHSLTQRSDHAQWLSDSARQLSRSAKSQRKESAEHKVSGQPVDNFLLDSSTNSQVDDRATLLRHLLTKAHDGSSDRAQNSRSLESSLMAADHFLQNTRAENITGLDSQVQVKQEPADDTDFMHACRSSSHYVSEARESFQENHESSPSDVFGAVSNNSGGDPGKQEEDSLKKMRSNSLLSADSDMSLRDILQRAHRPPQTCDSSASSASGSGVHGETVGEKRQQHAQDQSSLRGYTGKIPLSPADRLKTLSNMSLRDILTMKVPLGLGLGIGSTSAKDSANMAEISMDEEEGGHQVVWECGFCDFSASEKQEVMAHRERWHSDQMVHSQGGRYHEMSNDSERLHSRSAAAGHWSQQPSSGRQSIFSSIQSMHGRISGDPVTTASKTGLRHKVQKIYEDYDYHYQSSASPMSIESSSESEAETDDPDDRSYVPPRHILERTASSGSDSDTVKMNRTRSGSTRKYRHRGKVNTSSRDQSKKEKLLMKNTADFRAVATPKGDMMTKPVPAGQGQGFYNPLYLYKCQFCNHAFASLQVMKRHIRSSSDNAADHLLITEMVGYPHSVLYVCPKDDCSYVSVSEKAFLEHVLCCQGAILDASEDSVKEQILQACEQARAQGKKTGRFSCPVLGCVLSAEGVSTLQKHIIAHIERFHFSQMVLYHTVCTAMVKVHSTSKLGWYVCYLCNEQVSSVEAARSHAHQRHEGKMRGVLHVVSATSQEASGLLVSLTCLNCRQWTPDVNGWYKHSCLTTTSTRGNETSYKSHGGSECQDIPSLDQWPWMIAETAASDGSRQTTAEDMSSKKNQLPLVRSILMDKDGIISDKKNLTSVAGLGRSAASAASSVLTAEFQASQHVPSPEPHAVEHLLKADSLKAAGKDSGGGGSHTATSEPASSSTHSSKGDDDDVVSLAVCDVCNSTVPETDWKHHVCFAKMVRQAGDNPNSGPSSTSTSGQVASSDKQREEAEEDNSATPAAPSLTAGSKPMKGCYPFLTRSLQSPISRTEDKGHCHVQQTLVNSSIQPNSVSGAAASSSKKSAPSGEGDLTSTSVSAGSPSLRSLLAGPPGRGQDIVDREVRRTRGNRGILREKLLGENSTAATAVEAFSAQKHLTGQNDVMHVEATEHNARSRPVRCQVYNQASAQTVHATLGRVTRSCSGGTASQSETVSIHPASIDTASGMGESSDMVSWLHQQGSQMMRVLGNAMAKEDDEA